MTSAESARHIALLQEQLAKPRGRMSLFAEGDPEEDFEFIINQYGWATRFGRAEYVGSEAFVD